MIHQSIGGFHFINLNKDPSAGSGVLLSKNLVLTAAHNLYDKESQQELDKQTYRFYYQAENGIAIRFYKVANWKYLK
jgi:V8-like Glu-specific endopeptidase